MKGGGVRTRRRSVTLQEAAGLTQRQLDGFQLGIVSQIWVIDELEARGHAVVSSSHGEQIRPDGTFRAPYQSRNT